MKQRLRKTRKIIFAWMRVLDRCYFFFFFLLPTETGLFCTRIWKQSQYSQWACDENTSFVEILSIRIIVAMYRVACVAPIAIRCFLQCFHLRVEIHREIFQIFAHYAGSEFWIARNFCSFHVAKIWRLKSIKNGVII